MPSISFSCNYNLNRILNFVIELIFSIQFFRLILSLLAFFTLVATAHEGWVLLYGTEQSQDGLAVRYLHCFSIISNGKKLLSTNTQSGNLNCLNGIRNLLWFFVNGLFFILLCFSGVLSATWVILFHSYFILTVYRNTTNYDQLINQVCFHILNNTLSSSCSVFIFLLGIFTLVYASTSQRHSLRWHVLSDERFACCLYVITGTGTLQGKI
jgi:hypothetical protein